MKILLKCSILAATLTLVAIFAFPYYPDSFKECIRDFISSQERILMLFYEEETVYAEGYVETSWNKIKLRNSMDHVIKFLGPPLVKNIDKDGRTYFHYSKQGPKNTNYCVRIIVFDPENKVETIVKEFYLD